MAGEDAFQVEGVIVEVLSHRTYRAELANGHQVLAFVPGRARLSSAPLAPGDKVRLRMSPFDLSEGRILLAAE